MERSRLFLVVVVGLVASRAKGLQLSQPFRSLYWAADALLDGCPFRGPCVNDDASLSRLLASRLFSLLTVQCGGLYSLWIIHEQPQVSVSSMCTTGLVALQQPEPACSLNDLFASLDAGVGPLIGLPTSQPAHHLHAGGEMEAG
jgi:hypothetical protein